jgi:hypothetical protein
VLPTRRTGGPGCERVQQEAFRLGVLVIRTRGGHKADRLEDAASDGWLGDERDQFSSRPAFAFKGIDQEDPFEQLRITALVAR